MEHIGLALLAVNWAEKRQIRLLTAVTMLALTIFLEVRTQPSVGKIFFYLLITFLALAIELSFLYGFLLENVRAYFA